MYYRNARLMIKNKGILFCDSSLERVGHRQGALLPQVSSLSES